MQQHSLTNTNESKTERLGRLEAATNLIVHYPAKRNFRDLIDASGSLLEDFRLVYATDNLDSDFKGIRLKNIQADCPSLCSFFAGTGVLFYSADIFREMTRTGGVQIPIDYSVGFDTQIAEAFRLYESGKEIADWDRFCNLIQYIKRHNFNFDYTHYVIEDLVNAEDQKNMRPFNTIRALKRFDSIDLNALLKNPRNPKFSESKDDAGKRASDTLCTFLSSNEIKGRLIRRKVLLAVLMKATCLFWKSRADAIGNLSKLLDFAINHLGKFAKLEIYFAWKLFKQGENLRFFAPLSQPSERALSKLSGMSWDLFSIRHQETMASFSRRGTFFVPFFAAFDNRLAEMRDACPIRCLVIDEHAQRLNTIFADELEFFADVQVASNSELDVSLKNPQAKLGRLATQITDQEIENLLATLIADCRRAM